FLPFLLACSALPQISGFAPNLPSPTHLNTPAGPLFPVMFISAGSCNEPTSFTLAPEEEMATNFVQIKNDTEIKKRLEAERARLRKVAGLAQPEHFRRPVERAFTAEQRAHTTILFGGFTWKHEELIRAVFQGCGYRCERLPVPDVAAFQIGKEYGNDGQ